MKIALCFSGQPRSFEKGYDYYKKNLLDNYDVDIFIHSWNTEYNEKIIDLYKPKDYLFENKLEGNFDSLYTNTPDIENFPPRFTVSMLYSMYKSCQLKINYEMKQKFIYDWVIKSRTDYALNGKIPFENLDKNKLYIPHCRMVAEKDFGNDQFAFGSSETMNKRMSIYENMNHFYDQGVAMIGEDMMQAQIRMHHLIGDNLEYVDMNNPFPPGPRNGTPHSLIRDDYHIWKER
jgi:hypothetical protein